MSLNVGRGLKMGRSEHDNEGTKIKSGIKMALKADVLLQGELEGGGEGARGGVCSSALPPHNAALASPSPVPLLR